MVDCFCWPFTRCESVWLPKLNLFFFFFFMFALDFISYICKGKICFAEENAIFSLWFLVCMACGERKLGESLETYNDLMSCVL